MIPSKTTTAQPVDKPINVLLSSTVGPSGPKSLKLAFAARATGDHRLNEDLVAVPAMATSPTGSKADVGPGDALNCFEALGFRSRWAR